MGRGLLLILAVLMVSDADAAQCTICDIDAPGADATPGQENAYRICELAREVTCRVDDGAQCWAQRLADSVLYGTDRIVAALPGWMACGEHGNCPGILIAPGPILLPFIVVLAGIFVFTAARPMVVQRGGFGETTRLGVRVLVAWIAVSFMATGGADQLWGVFGYLMAFAAQAGLQLSDNAVAGMAASDACYPAGTGTGWVGYRSALDGYLVRLLDILSIAVVVGYSAFPGFGAIGNILGEMATLDADIIMRLLRLMVAFTVMMLGATMTTTFLITIAETLLTVAILLALTPITILLAIFEPTRSALVGSCKTAFASTMVGVTAGIGIALATTIGAFATSTFLGLIITDAAIGAPECPDELADGNLRELTQTYLEFLACETSTRPSTLFEAGDAWSLHWLPALLVFAAAFYVISAMLRFATTVCRELAGSDMNMGQTASTVAGGLQGMTSRAAGMLPFGRGR